MNCDDVTHDQARRVHEALDGPLLYLQRLEQRLTDRAFDPAERFYQLVVEAHNAIHRLSIETHFMSCKTGVGRLPGNGRKPPDPGR